MSIPPPSTRPQASDTPTTPTDPRIESLRVLIGGTAMLQITARFRGREHTICTKYEIQNFTGSIKDRLALHSIERGYASGALLPGDTIAEATSGNTGISFAAVGRALGHPVRIFMPDWMSQERVLVIRSLGAEVIPVSREQGGFVGAIAMADAYAQEHERVWQPRQFQSEANVEAHRTTTGPEILAQMATIDTTPSAFVAGVGTGGTVMGVGACLREHVPGVTIHPLEPANSPTLRTGKKVGKHRIQGISDEFVPAIVDLEALDRLVDVWDGDAILMAQQLASQFGLGVGISSGANFLGALSIAHELDADQDATTAVATVFCDSNKKYLSTDLCSEEPPCDDYLSQDVELLTCRVLPGVRV